MKIENGMHRSSKLKSNNRLNIDNRSMDKNFSDFLNQEGQRYSKELLDKLLENIDDQGKKLILTKNLKELKAYKTLIKKYMDEVIKSAISIDDNLSYDQYGRSKRYKIIRQLDKKLLELTDSAIQKESDQIRLLDQIGEIKGLLINLYY